MKRLLFRTGFAVLLVFLSSISAQANVTLNENNFPDESFRNAVSQATGVPVNGTITDSQISALTTLDVHGMDIRSLRGLGYLTGLINLDISDNNNLSTGADITGLTALTTLKASNCNLVTLAGITGTSNITHVTGSGLTIGANNANLISLDISNNPDFYASGNLQHLTRLETLLLTNCTHYDGWIATVGNALTKLKYLDASHCDLNFVSLSGPATLEHFDVSYNTRLAGISTTAASSTNHYIKLNSNCSNLKYVDVSYCTNMDRIFLYSATHLVHLNAAGTKIKGFSSNLSTSDATQYYITLSNTLGNNGTLKYLNLSNCSNLNSFRALANAYHVTSLDSLILTNDTGLGWSNDGFEAQTNITYLDVTNCDISTAGPDYIPKFDNLKNLETLLYGENPDVGYLRITGNSNLKTLDLHNNTGLTMLALDNCGLPRNNLNINGTNCPALTGLKLNNNGYTSISEAMNNASTWGFDNVKFLYLENNNFGGGALTLTSNECNGLTGLDLSNNNFTSFAAPSLPENLTALMIGKNPNMKRLEMHHNPGIITMAADTVMSDGSGLYLLGNTGLTYMDISGTADQPNYFQRIGNNFSLANVPIDTLKASHNQFYTFRNLTEVPGDIYEYWGEKYVDPADGKTKYKNVYHMSTAGNLESAWRYKAYWPTMEAMPDSASLEQLPNLRYLDLSHCQLKDSVYLHKNTDLRYLDVSHNRNIIRSFDSSSSNSKYAKAAAFRAYISNSQNSSTNFADYKKYMWLVTNTDIREYYTNDCNDTIGLYILDLLDNNKLEYLDVSYTGIEQTALTHGHVSNARYIWIQDLPELKYFYADYNGMRSMGIGTQNGKKREGDYTPTAALKSLERLSVIGMRGTDNTTMQGSINFRENTLCTKLHYINLAYGRFDSIGVYIPTVDTLILRGNPLHYVNMQKADNITYLDVRECAFKTRGYDVETEDMFFPNVNIYKNGARIGGQYYGNSTNIPAANPTNTGDLTTPFSGLRGVKAYKRNHLTTVLLDNCNALTNVYCHDDPLLPKIHGFDNLAFNQSYDATYNFPPTDADSLTLVYVQNNKVFNELNLTKNNNLHYLHAYNDSTLGTTLGGTGMDLTANKNLVSAWVSNSRLERFVNDAGQHLDTLKVWQNPELDSLDVSDNGNLRYFDLGNCMIRTLNLDNNKKLTYFDCSNRDSIWTDYEHFTFNMPGSVPTVIDDPGKNSIADLHFKSDSLRVVHADNNDLYCIDGLSTNHKLYKLTYSYNHINAIDLSGCDSLVNDNYYNCYHNVRGLIPGELSSWKTTVNNVTTEHNLYYFQLEKNAGDGLNGHNTFLGIKCGQDSLLSDQTSGYERQLEVDGFDPTKVIVFTKNSSGPHHGSRTPASGAPMRVNVDPSEQLDPDSFYGTIAILDKYDLVRNYIEYIYDDQRPIHRNRDGGGSAFGIAWNPPGIPTVVDETAADDLGELTVVSERYFDAAGAEHREPVSGVNIIVRQMSDGSTETVKVIK